MNTVGDAVKDLQTQLGLDSEFFHKLLIEDDWTFIIKMHALMEAAVTQSLCTRLGEESLQDVFSYTELGNKKCGKIAFAKALNLLEKEHRSFLSTLSELRNNLVHNIENVNFNLPRYIGDMDSQQFNSFMKKCDNFSTPDQDLGTKVAREDGKVVLVETQFRENPKQALWNSGLSVLFTIYARKLIHKQRV